MKEMRAGKDRPTVPLEAGHQRARPIVMTTVAMAAGMLPIALGFGAVSAFRGPMAIAVIGGLITSTGLTLVLICLAAPASPPSRSLIALQEPARTYTKLRSMHQGENQERDALPGPPPWKALTLMAGACGDVMTLAITRPAPAAGSNRKNHQKKRLDNGSHAP